MGTVAELAAPLLLARGRPPKPTRDQICAVRMTFQGLTVQTDQYGAVNWFEPAIDVLSASNRQRVYAAKHVVGDTHLALAVSHAYQEPGISAPIATGADWTQNLHGFHGLVSEAIENGFYVLLFCAGDGDGSGPGYNDPVGWTYGKQWLAANFVRLYEALGDVAPYLVWVPGFDGVVPGWQPPHSVDPVLLQMRDVLGNSGYLGLELAAGYASWGDGGSNWISPAGQAVDLILCEFPGPPTGDQVWQIAARLLGPAYRRPPDQPAGDDPRPPFYLSTGTPRGPFTVCGFEYDAYRWVRGQVTATEIQHERDYLRGCGFTYVG